MSPVVGISVITPKPGLFDQFMELQLAQLNRLRGKVAGVRGSRLYRARDGRSVVLVALFETAEDQKRFSESAVLQEHLARRVIGQDHAMDIISQRVQPSRASLDDPNKPVGVFMLVGPSGAVGGPSGSSCSRTFCS